MAPRNFLVAFVNFCICRTHAVFSHSVRPAQDAVQTKALRLHDGFAILQAAQQPDTSKLKLEIHYETLCPHCLELIGKVLPSIWDDAEMRERLDISMFPSAGITVHPVGQLSEGWRAFHPETVQEGFEYVFECQHGEEECLGNLIHACAQKLLGEPDAYMPFLLCMEAGALHGNSAEKSAFECMKQTTAADPNDLVTCTKSAEANRMMYSMYKYSHSLSPPVSHAPWVIINGKHSDSVDSHGDLLAALCAAFDAPLPAACSQRR